MIGVVAILPLALLAFATMLPVFYDYRVHDRGIQFVLFKSIPVWTVPGDQIIEVRPTESEDMFPGVFRTLVAGNRIWRLGRGLIIRRSRGWIREIRITPANNAGFLEALSRIGVRNSFSG